MVTKSYSVIRLSDLVKRQMVNLPEIVFVTNTDNYFARIITPHLKI